MIKCKECGGDVSSKADSCPKCGVRLRSKPEGCIVGLFRLIGGLAGLAIATFFLYGGEKRSPVQGIESSCRSGANSFPIESGREDFYSNCVASANAMQNPTEQITSPAVSVTPNTPSSANDSRPVQSTEPPFNGARNPEAVDGRGTLVKTPETKSFKCGLADATLEFETKKGSAFGAEAIITVKRGEDLITYYTDEEFVGMECRESNPGKFFVVFQAYCGGIICKDFDNFGIVDTESVRLLLEPSDDNRAEAKKLLGEASGQVLKMHSMHSIGEVLSTK